MELKEDQLAMAVREAIVASTAFDWDIKAITINTLQKMLSFISL